MTLTLFSRSKYNLCKPNGKMKLARTFAIICIFWITMVIGKVYIYTNNAPVICNHCSPPTGNSRDNDFSSTTALLKALYCGDLLRVIALLFIRVNSTGYRYLRNITSPALTQYCGGTQKVIALHISPAIPVGGVGGGAGVTNDWCITS